MTHFELKTANYAVRWLVCRYACDMTLRVWSVHWAHTWWLGWFGWFEWVEKAIAGFAGPHLGTQPAGELLRGFRLIHTLQLVTLGPFAFVFLPFVGDRSQILSVRGTLQSTSDITNQRLGLYTGLRRGLWSRGKNTGHLQSHSQLE